MVNVKTNDTVDLFKDPFSYYGQMTGEGILIAGPTTRVSNSGGGWWVDSMKQMVKRRLP